MSKINNDLMETVNLVTDSSVFVASVEIPKFTPEADVLIWGARFFKKSDDGFYKEAFVYAIPPKAQG